MMRMTMLLNCQLFGYYSGDDGMTFNNHILTTNDFLDCLCHLLFTQLVSTFFLLPFIVSKAQVLYFRLTLKFITKISKQFSF